MSIWYSVYIKRIVANNIAFLALGSNIGDSAGTLSQAVTRLASVPEITVCGVSSLYQTSPVGGPEGQSDYCNGVVRVETGFAPRELLTVCLKIEAEFGRLRRLRWAPRTLDIDVLLYGNLSLSDDLVTVPHPRLRDRLFVLAPLADVAGRDWPMPPDGERLGSILDRLELASSCSHTYCRKISTSVLMEQ